MEIKKADEKELDAAIALSEKYCYKNSSPDSKGYILKPITREFLNSLYVAKIGDKVVGAVCAPDFSEEDFKIYGVNKDLKRKQFVKVTVDKDYRGKQVASNLIRFVMNKYPDVRFYASIMENPVENVASKRLFNSLGFKCYKTMDSHYNDLNLSETSGFYVCEKNKK